MSSQKLKANTCRICMESGLPVYNIYECSTNCDEGEEDVTLANALDSLTSIKNSIADKFSKVLCSECCTELTRTFTFMNEVIKSDQKILLFATNPKKFFEERALISKKCDIEDESQDEIDIGKCEEKIVADDSAHLNNHNSEISKSSQEIFEISNFNDIIDDEDDMDGAVEETDHHLEYAQNDNVIYLNCDDEVEVEEDEIGEAAFLDDNELDGDVAQAVAQKQVELMCDLNEEQDEMSLPTNSMIRLVQKPLKRKASPQLKSVHKRMTENNLELIKVHVPQYLIADIDFNTLHHEQLPLDKTAKTIEIQAIQVNINEKIEIDIPPPEIGVSAYVCKYCPNGFSTPHHLVFHLRRSHLCQHCLNVFENYHELSEHVGLAHRDFKCFICNRSFTNHSNVRAHQRKMHDLVLPPYVAIIPTDDDDEEGN